MKKIFNVFLVFLVAFIVSGCNKAPEYILIGFTNELTGSHRELGVAALYGALIAVEEINEQGGINGKEIRLEIRNDEGNPELANQHNQELIDMGAVLIIGAGTSKMLDSVVGYANEKDFLVISPTASTRLVTGVDDNLIRLIPDDSMESEYIASYYSDLENEEGLIIVFDNSNAAYALTLADDIRSNYIDLGNTLPDENFLSFESVTEQSISVLIDKINLSENHNLVIIASEYDASVIIQNIENREDYDIFLAMWSASEYLIDVSGENIYGCKTHRYLNESTSEKYLSFQDKYEEIYDSHPEYSSVFGYELVYVVYEALLSVDVYTSEVIKEAILQKEEYEGLISSFSFTETGDVIRPIYPYIITENGYEVMTNVNED